MNLPTQSEVSAATKHVASFAAGAIAIFGLSTKLDPNTVQQIIAACGSLVNDAILLIGLVAPIVTSFYASKSASVSAQADAITKAVPGTLIVTTKALANSTTSPNVISHDVAKVLPR
jgi:hypothetical protein